MKPGDLVFVANDASWIHCFYDEEYVGSITGAKHFHEGEPMMVLRVFSARWRGKNSVPLDEFSEWVEALTSSGKSVINVKAFDPNR